MEKSCGEMTTLLAA